MATTIYPQTISPADALWALYQSQTKKVREAFRLRLLSEEQKQIANSQEAMVKESLTRAFDELHTGKVHHNARKLFK